MFDDWAVDTSPHLLLLKSFMIQLMRNLPRRIASLDDEFLNTSDHLLKDDDDGDAAAYDDDHVVHNNKNNNNK